MDLLLCLPMPSAILFVTIRRVGCFCLSQVQDDEQAKCQAKTQVNCELNARYGNCLDANACDDAWELSAVAIGLSRGRTIYREDSRFAAAIANGRRVEKRKAAREWNQQSQRSTLLRARVAFTVRIGACMVKAVRGTA